MIRKLRKYWRLAAILAGFAFCVPLHYLWKLFGARSPWPRIFLGHVGRRFGLRVRKEGNPLTSNVLYTPNHVSWLDILAVGGAVPAVFVTKAELDGIVRWASALNDSVYIDRNMRSAVKGQASDLRGRLAEGRAVCLFPEGTTSGRLMLPFRPSLFASLYPPLPGVMVQPVQLDFAQMDDAAWIGDEAYELSVTRFLERPGRLDVTIRFLEPIDPAEAGDRKALAAQSRRAVLTGLRGVIGIEEAPPVALEPVEMVEAQP
ncbi:lysophospholipid acyltransferase family protein [Allosphingosinicella sp.]|uniref:lysophospholipid acyltransferase family protein n=1 Tax=Allosphingosinicella sp. TaxID=2823234 RepID=UPI0037850D80